MTEDWLAELDARRDTDRLMRQPGHLVSVPPPVPLHRMGAARERAR